MKRLEELKQKKIHEIISIVKLTSLLFSAIALLTYFFGEKNRTFAMPNTYFTLISSITIMLLLTSIYTIWAFSTTKKYNYKHMRIIKTIENGAFIFIFCIAILITGGHTSSYKFLFLFIIITTTIQEGMKQGLITAIISSCIILTIDLIGGSSTNVNQYFENDLIIVGVFILTAWPLGFYVKIEKSHIEQLINQANVDGLTGLYNHRYFHENLREKMILSEKENQPISMIIMDIDYFKYYNDLYGHQKGDEALKRIGTLLKEIAREKDVVARYGGEEFSIILPNTDEAEVIRIGEHIRKKIETTYFEGEENLPNGKLTVSVGISVFPDKAKSDVELIKSADDALYRAKFFNKNRVEIYTSILDELKQDIEEKHIDLVTSIKTLISVINAKDKYTYGHVERVVVYSRLLAEKLNLNEDDKKALIYGAYMHDIGKINISEDILNKKMPLNNEEWNILKQHSSNGVQIIRPVESLKYLSPLILHHHERYDGKGYPHNLKGEEIPYLARILTVVDSFDAMTSNRPYNKRKTYEEGIEELKKCSGTQFDPVIVQEFSKVILENKDSLGK
ncbi:diguanylate cyclase (GGDEF)-like protein [Clostridium punense]|uniref:Diguanylate cyclase (GGDEF)-like protein n=1 Tax=Clostridium punense TaxID=1054297 RepID=A0ABS4K781_9CLOT|nr:diguanylate cyclase [Clostridium punense]MBP2023652.1 diguanylate cyclase (GGDEF)-like protein [Clostridium punense]